MPLNVKQQRFVEEYAIDMNATQAAIRTGYSAKTAYSQGQRLLKHVDVKQAIEKQKARVSERCEVTAAELRAELDRIALGNLSELLDEDEDGRLSIKPLRQLTKDQTATLSEITVESTASGERRHKVKQHNKLRAIELALKLRGQFDEEEVSYDEDGNETRITRKVIHNPKDE